MKRVLIISPYFVPSNAADMQRVRMSLPYFTGFGWEAEVVCVDEKYSEMVKDELLLQSLPAVCIIHIVKAFDKSWTGKLGLGSLALRSMWFYLKKVNALLRQQHYDLIYFSTTQFPLTVLGRCWKNKFNVPYVIDMQDPWHSDYYQDKPKNQRPKKYWFSYRLNKWLEPIAMKKADGLISVSDNYISDLQTRYPQLKKLPAATITFGAFEPDVKIAADNREKFKPMLQNGYKNIVYVGRGGKDLLKAITPLFEALKKGMLGQPQLFGQLKFYFIGTSYAPAGTGIPTIIPLAESYNLTGQVIEITDRISYYHTLVTLQQADALFIPGSDDPKYTASKIYPYLLTQKPLLAIFNKASNVVGTINDCTANANVLTFTEETAHLTDEVFELLTKWAQGLFIPITLNSNFEKYSARVLTNRQTELFNSVIKQHATANTNA